MITIASLTVREAARRRILWILLGLTIGSVALTGWGIERLASLARENGSEELRIQTRGVADPDPRRVHVQLRAGHDRCVPRRIGDRGGCRIRRRPRDARPADPPRRPRPGPLAGPRDRRDGLCDGVGAPRDRCGGVPYRPQPAGAADVGRVSGVRGDRGHDAWPVARDAAAVRRRRGDRVVVFGLAWMAGVFAGIARRSASTCSSRPRGRAASCSRPTACGAASSTASSRRS